MTYMIHNYDMRYIYIYIYMESCIILDETYLMLRHHDPSKEIKILSENLYPPMSAYYFSSISSLSNII